MNNSARRNMEKANILYGWLSVFNKSNSLCIEFEKPDAIESYLRDHATRPEDYIVIATSQYPRKHLRLES